MTKLIFVTLMAAVTLEGKTIEAGEALTISEFSGNALIDEGKAELTEQVPGEDAGDTPGDETGTSGTIPPGDDKTPPEGSQTLLNVTDPEAERLAVFTAIDAQYTDKELRPAAKDALVEFAYDAKKGDVINAIIDQDKVAAILK